MASNNTNHKSSLGALQHGIAGAGAGAVAALVTCPLDVVKTVLQVQRSHHHGNRYRGTIGTFRTILMEEGVAGLYKGLGTTLVALIPNWAIYFYTYNACKQFAVDSGYHEGPLMHMSTAMAAAAVTDVFTTPLWMIKTRLQTQKMAPNTERKYKSTLGALSVIVKEEGPLALWKGLLPQLIGIIHVAVQFPLYEYMKEKLAERSHKDKDNLSAMELVVASSGSKITASIVAYPHEVLRSRFQYQHTNDPHRYKNIGNAIKRILAEEGIKGFYRGMGTNLLRVTPSCAITFTVYELLVRAVKPE